MTRSEREEYTEQREHRPFPSKILTSDKEDQANKEIDISPSRFSLRSSARLSRKRELSPSPSEPARRQSQVTHPSTSIDSSKSGTDEGPSQYCLCQPDPKVPRPRNGMICDGRLI
jgi:hypothetical protein